MSKWVMSSDYHWTGPPGWTICSCGIGQGKRVFELWEGESRSGGGCRFRGASLDMAIAAYEDLTGDKTDYAEIRAAQERMDEAREISHPAFARFSK